MNSVQLHLALTHVPVIVSLVGLMMLLVAFFIKNPTLTKTSYVLIIIAGIFALPVFFTGEPAEDAVENLAGVSGAAIEEHEEIAKFAMIAIAVAGLCALIALYTFKWQVARILRIMVLGITIIAGGLMVQTARLGGSIRHTEISKVMPPATDQNAGEAKRIKLKDDD